MTYHSPAPGVFYVLISIRCPPTFLIFVYIITSLLNFGYQVNFRQLSIPQGVQDFSVTGFSNGPSAQGNPTSLNKRLNRRPAVYAPYKLRYNESCRCRYASSCILKCLFFLPSCYRCNIIKPPRRHHHTPSRHHHTPSQLFVNYWIRNSSEFSSY